MTLIISIFFALNLGQTQEPSYVLCLSETTSEIFTMKSDSSLVRRSSGEQWKGKNRAIGRWQKKNGLVIWQISGHRDESYETDTLRRLQFSIPVALMQKWQSVKQSIRKSISTDEDIHMLETFMTEGRNSSQDREKGLERREFDIAFKFICGSEIVIRKQNER